MKVILTIWKDRVSLWLEGYSRLRILLLKAIAWGSEGVVGSASPAQKAGRSEDCSSLEPTGDLGDPRTYCYTRENLEYQRIIVFSQG